MRSATSISSSAGGQKTSRLTVQASHAERLTLSIADARPGHSALRTRTALISTVLMPKRHADDRRTRLRAVALGHRAGKVRSRPASTASAKARAICGRKRRLRDSRIQQHAVEPPLHDLARVRRHAETRIDDQRDVRQPLAQRPQPYGLTHPCPCRSAHPTASTPHSPHREPAPTTRSSVQYGSTLKPSGQPRRRFHEPIGSGCSV